MLRALREARKQSLRSVAQELGVAPSYLSRVERGERGYNKDLSERLAQHYGISSDDMSLVEGTIPEDIVKILLEHPDEIVRLRQLYGPQTGASGD
jgi:transcriptional regulator with XRE-family HTH domain